MFSFNQYFDLNQILKALLRIQNLYPDLCTPLYVKSTSKSQQCLYLRHPNFRVKCPTLMISTDMYMYSEVKKIKINSPSV